MATRLTIRRLVAMLEALESRLAGEIDIENEPGSPTREDYEAASDWVAEQIDRRKAATA